ncbi:MAG TPA: hypothetical protein VM509_10730 [Planctomycetota bacterium]|nr:hypothetical protein [Planctomycetota bacterium]
MSRTRRFTLLFSLLLAPLTVVAHAQIAATAPFVGEQSESFDNLNAGQFNTCHATHILGGTAELCPTPSGDLFVVGTAHCFCAMQPQGTTQALTGNGAHIRIEFLTPAIRFGGEFALNCNLSDGHAEFFDTSGALIASLPLTVAADCAWHWQGFAAAPGVEIGSVELFSNHPLAGNLIMENLQADYAVAFATYCVAKPNSMNCIPRIEAAGVPVAGATSGWQVSAVRVAGGFIPGVLIYTVGAARNAMPFQCGTLCVGPGGIRRTIGVFSSNGSLCNASYSIDMNAFSSGFLGGNPSAALSVVGTLVHCQWWGRDNGFAPPCNSTLSDGLEYVIQ